jgi:hypothetical protein
MVATARMAAEGSNELLPWLILIWWRMGDAER